MFVGIYDHDRLLDSNLPHPSDLEIEMWVRHSLVSYINCILAQILISLNVLNYVLIDTLNIRGNSI